MREGLLYAGTDDGNLQISRDGGRVWANVKARLPGLPPSAWISGIEPSRQAEGTVYVAVNNYRNNDFANYLYRSDDFGATYDVREVSKRLSDTVAAFGGIQLDTLDDQGRELA